MFLSLLVFSLFVTEVHTVLSPTGDNVCSYTATNSVRYTTSCGWWGRRCDRYRTAYYTAYKCCPYWNILAAASTSCDVPYCVGGWDSCPNGGTCMTANHCKCIRGYFSPDCVQCTVISNCPVRNTDCTSLTDHRCVECDYEYDHIIRAYKPIDYGGYPERVCQQLCSWRPDSKQCYPGTCSDGTPGSCQCAPDFGGTDCMEISSTPDIIQCLATITDSQGERAEVNCEDVTRPVKYTNIRIAKLKVDWITQYKGPPGTGTDPGSTYTYPYYVNDFDVGVTAATVDWTISRGSPFMASISSGSVGCNSGISASNPDQSARVCGDEGTISTSVLSGDLLHLSIKSTNGGRLKIHNYDQSATSPVTEEQFYVGKTLTHSASYRFDFDPPYHCLSGCTVSMLERGDAYTRQATFSISWGGWTDDISGVKMYQYEVYKFKPLGAGDSAVLDYKTEAPVVSVKVDSLPATLPSVTLAEPGMYCVLLIVYDDTSDNVLHSNHRLARRFLLYDDSSSVETSNHPDQQMVVTSAAENTTYLWITTLDQPVRVEWTNHFYNDFHRTNYLLNAIAPHSTEISAEYEERVGQPHGYRSMEAIPNVNGVVRYDLMFATDHDGGRTITSPSFTWETLVNFQNEGETRTIERSDGDSVRFWVRTFDVMNSSVVDSVLVHVDSTPPHIEGEGLVRDGDTYLVVHNNRDIFDMTLQFDTYDYHSGIKQITWVLEDMKDGTKHGEGALAVITSSIQNCAAPICYCIEKDEECYERRYQVEPEQAKLNIPYADHDYDYLFIITVVNNAMLQTTHTFQITVDTSPPLPGHVFDAEPGNKDIDYQSGLTVHASWNGFFDRESGIKQYKYGIHTACLSEADFVVGASPPTQIVTTFDTFTSESVSDLGTYYTTVVAYNHALEPSHPVCTDGVTIDTTGPVVTSIHVSQAYVKPGLVSDGETMMYMDGEGFVYELTTITQDCGSTPVSDLSLFAGRSFLHPIKPHQDNCSSYTAAGGRHYLATANMFELSWEGTDAESTIHEYMITLSSTETGNGDIMPSTSSHGHNYFITYHPNLVDYKEFYVSIKAINKAGLQSVETVGPYQVRANGPDFNGEMTVTLKQSNGEMLMATLQANAYSTTDVDNEYLSDVQYSLGEGSCSGNLVSWTPVTNPANSLGCDNSWPPTCVLIDPHTQGFHLHHNTDYCLSLRLHGYNKLVTSTSVWYSHSKPKPYSGLLWEVDTSTQDLVLRDIDYQTSSTSVELRLLQDRGQSASSLQYSVAVGTSPGAQDGKAFHDVVRSGVIQVENLTLQVNTQYFSTLKLLDSDTDEFSLVVSDGFIVLPENTELPEFVVYDGMTCKSVDSDVDRHLNHHLDATGVPECDKDIDYQPYTSRLAAYWTYKSEDSHVQYFMVSVHRLNSSGETESWEAVVSDQFVGDVQEVELTALYLEGGETYRVVIQACHPAGCYNPLATDAVMILPTEPVAKDIREAVYNATETSLFVTWHAWVDPYHGVDVDVISQYAIALFVRPEYREELSQITKWIHLKREDYQLDPETNLINTTHLLDEELEPSSCLVLGVRGFNRAMLYSTTYREVTGCTVPDRYDLMVFDAVGEKKSDGSFGDIHLTPNDAWPEPDLEYTGSKSSLAAVWPTLRHGQMQWSVVHGDNVNRLAYRKDNLAHLGYWDFDCNLPEVLACGTTEDRFINVHSLALTEGSRYHICVYANQTNLTHEKWTEELAEVSVCTNGVTVASEPPLAGHVWIGNRQEHSHFQSDSSLLVVHWADFVDVEVNQRTSHHSSIKTYRLAIGSSRGGEDVLAFHNVGLTNIKTVTGLSLKNGQTYYATIQALDYVGLETLVISEGVTIDINPAITNQDKLIASSHYLTAQDSIQITYSNGAFIDPESGVTEYTWCIGSAPRLCDTLPRTPVTEPVLTVTGQTATFDDGQEYHVRLEARNGAGLAVSTIASTFVVDMSAPHAGFVYEVNSNDLLTDIDYQVSPTELHLVWGDFSDPESHILEYRLSVGSCVNCTDVLDHVYVGLVQEYSLTHLSLWPGTEYHTGVTGCNSAGLCTTSSSDGVTVDSTPPHLGGLYDGLFGDDVDYQSKNDLIQAHLENIHDIQSDLSIISWWAGTSAGDTDVFTEETTHSHTVLQRSLTTPLSEGTTVFVSVKVCNKAGLCIEKSSDGSTVDTSAPSFTGVLELNPTIATLSSDHQVYRNTLSMQWLAAEDISPLVITYVSLLPQDDAHLVLPTVQLTGNPQSHTFSGLDLRDGDCYVAKVTVCNAANICSQKTSAVWIVDSSPPISGAFAVDTEHAVELSRQRDGFMTYDNNMPSVKLAWVGFQDPHSDIHEYHVQIGTGYYSTDIATETFNHQSTDPHRDEGQVVTETVSISRALTANEEIYISIYATSKAGLQSTILHGLFNVIPSGGDTGILDLERRCSVLSCVGHCMCSPHGVHGCDITGSSCTDRTGDSAYAKLTVYDTLPSVASGVLTDMDYIPSRHILHADWTVGSGISPKWFDWSVGIKDQSPGTGLLDVNSQRIWYEGGTTAQAVFSLSESKFTDAMSPHVTYVFHIKAWYDSQSYAIYQSDGVQVDSTAPERSDSYSVLEVDNTGSAADVDFTASATQIAITWTNVFRDSQSGFDGFKVTLYSDKMLEEVETVEVDGDSDVVSLTGLSLKQGEHYTTKVVACNKAGLCTEATSDGFTVDLTPPTPGVVLDGTEYHDVQYSALRHQVSASWQGFYDDQSGLDHYMWCVRVGSVNMPCTDVGLNVQKTMALTENGTNGEVVSSTVYAVNAAGLSSPQITSDGYIMDNSPPTDKHWFNFGDSIIQNGDFESDTTAWGIDADRSYISKNKLCLLNGHISQSVSTTTGQKYRLQFDTVNGFESGLSVSLGYVTFGSKEHHTISAANVDDDLHLQQKVYFLTAHGSSSVLDFGTMTDAMICLGNIRLQPITEGSRDIDNTNNPEASFTSSVHVHVRASSTGTSLILNWHFEDLETPIVEYMFAVGTVKGGNQIQDFTSTGTHSTAHVSGVIVHQATALYVSVVATNAVGLSTVVHADPVIVDMTPPVIDMLKVNGDNPVLSTQTLSVQWQTSDPESAVKSCQFSIESDDADQDALATFSSSDASGSNSLTLSDISNGDILLCRIVCQSFRNLYTEHVSPPITYISEASDTSSASVHIIPYSETFHDTRGNYLSSPDMVWFRWDGIVDPIGIHHCEVTISGGPSAILESLSLGSHKHSIAVLHNASQVFQDEMSYDLNLTCTNMAGFDSHPIITQFHIDSNFPVYTDETLGVSWSSETHVNLNWSGLFTATAQMIFEIQLGTTQGGNDVLSWLETKAQELEVTDIDSSRTHYLSISAISQNGLYVTRAFTVRY